jgi:hypothetical protein
MSEIVGSSVPVSSKTGGKMTVVEQGEMRRKMEAVRQLVEEIAAGKIDNIPPIIRSAIEV